MWIEFEFNVKILFILIYPIFKRIEDFTRDYLTKDNRLFKTFRYFLSYGLNFIPYLIIKFRSKRNNKEDKEKEKKEEKDYIEDDKKGVLNIFIKKQNKITLIKNVLFLFLLSFLGFFFYYFTYWKKDNTYRFAKQSMGIFFTIINYIVLSYFILNQKLFRHNYVSAGIIIFILFILFIITSFYIESDDYFPAILIDIFFSLGFGTYDILGKKYMNIFYQNPYFLLFAIGIINMILLLIFDLFVYFLESDIDGIIIGFKNNVFSVSKFFLFIFDIIIEWIWNIGIRLTIYYLTPCHYFMSQYVSEYIYYLIKAYDSNKEFYSTNNIIIFSIAFFINIFCCLVFNEVVILNFCKLDYNTAKRIREREFKDAFEILNKEFELNYNIIKDEETDNNIN